MATSTAGAPGDPCRVANSIFAGEKLLTTPNPDFDEDKKMFELLGLKPRAAYKDHPISV